MRLGIHVRIGKGLLDFLERVNELQCESAQLFSGNPNAWARTPVDPAVAEVFRARSAQYGIAPVVLHTPYLVNLACPDDDIWFKSTAVLADAVARADLLNAAYVVTHIGSHKGAGYDVGLDRIARAVDAALSAGQRSTIALELGAGAGRSIGSTFEEVSDILERLPDAGDRVGICIDTAHLWAAGYRIDTAEGVGRMFQAMQRHVGLERLKVIHLNDTLKDAGSHVDRHHHIGEGRLGVECFWAILHHPGTADVPGILETPGETMEMGRKNLEVLRALRDSPKPAF